MKIKKLLLFFLINGLHVTAHANPAPWVGVDLSGKPCTGSTQGFGPFDYTKATKGDKAIGGNLNLVERAHFTSEVEYLIKGHSGYLEGDIDYTIRAWPNHPRALLSAIRYQLEVKNKIRTGKLSSPPECYLQRAIHFNPEDAASKSLYGYYLHKMGDLENALEYYKKALIISPNDSKIAYSYSLLLLDLKKYEESVKYAKIAYTEKTTPKGLKQKLEKLNVWHEEPESHPVTTPSKSTDKPE